MFIASGERRQGGPLGEAVHPSGVGTVGSRGRGSGGGGPCHLVKGGASTGEAGIAESAIWGLGVWLTVRT